jgi:2-dehydro-3-deoxygalactonokinase
MTGELFSLLSRHSVLRHGVAPDGWDEGAFAAAVADALSHPERTSASLFTIRAEGLIGQLSPESARARLSGLLIGMELAGARPYWLGTEVAIIGASRVARAYTSALSEQGVAVTLADVGDMTRAGLAASVAEAQGAAA